ncbi:DUF305 domain-containing protein [Actinoplanes regularis]|uniref:DUF305 domain-containing protein n=1 Tax=Actinoplanes regularis TaxID=52697 RepID=UPI0024A58359|nr:DUF305 domain-containing protein [Actinoplanes regularis]GLW33714.1 hypothetical protein Areg01_66520 [Actinoplanes regularis]
MTARDLLRTAGRDLLGMVGCVVLLAALPACDAPAPRPAAVAPGSVGSAVAVPAPMPMELAYVAHMAEHHRQALRLVRILHERGGVPYRTADLADHIAAMQAGEAAEMTEFLKAWGAGKPAGHEHMSAVLSEAQIRSLRRSSGAAAGRLFLQLMIVHHRGAVEMSTQMLPMADNPWVISLARHVIADQRVEIGSMQRILDTHE